MFLFSTTPRGKTTTTTRLAFYLLWNGRGRAVVVALRVLAIVVRRSLFVDHYFVSMMMR